MGASLGGLMTMYMGYERPEVFGRLGAISPTFCWSDGRIFEHWKQRHPVFSRIYIDCGSEERIWLEDLFLDYPKYSQDFHDHLQALGYQAHELKLVVEQGAHHHEIDWQRRFPSMIRWLLAD
jgi:predicted alpha/beta superfamily hydrolase